MKEVRYHKLKANTVIGSKDKPTTWDVGLWSLATLKDTFFLLPIFWNPFVFFFEKCLTSNQPNGILVDLFDAGLPAWLASSSVWQSCYAPASLPGTGYLVRKIRGIIGDWNYWFLRISRKGFFSPGFFRHSAFFCEICTYFCWKCWKAALHLLNECCVCAFKGFLKAVSSTSTPLRVVNATFFDLADFYQFLGWPSNGCFLWTLELIAFLAEVSMACLVYHGWDIGTQDR